MSSSALRALFILINSVCATVRFARLSRNEPWQRLPCLRARLGATNRLSDGGDKSHAVHGALRSGALSLLRDEAIQILSLLELPSFVSARCGFFSAA
jgi:hypothetical protein